MSTIATRKSVPSSRGFRRRNTMAFPRELRAAIPDLYEGRILELDSISARACQGPPWNSKLVEVKLLVKETGKLKGEFVVVMNLQSDAARKLAATLTELADQA